MEKIAKTLLLRKDEKQPKKGDILPFQTLLTGEDMVVIVISSHVLKNGQCNIIGWHITREESDEIASLYREFSCMKLDKMEEGK